MTNDPEVLTVIYRGRTIIVQDGDGKILAAGSPKSVGDSLKQRFIERIASPGV